MSLLTANERIQYSHVGAVCDVVRQWVASDIIKFAGVRLSMPIPTLAWGRDGMVIVAFGCASAAIETPGWVVTSNAPVPLRWRHDDGVTELTVVGDLAISRPGLDQYVRSVVFRGHEIELTLSDRFGATGARVVIHE